MPYHGRLFPGRKWFHHQIIVKHSKTTIIIHRNHMMSCHVMSCMSFHDMSYHVMISHVMCCRIISCNVLSHDGHAILHITSSSSSPSPSSSNYVESSGTHYSLKRSQAQLNASMLIQQLNQQTPQRNHVPAAASEPHRKHQASPKCHGSDTVNIPECQ